MGGDHEEGQRAKRLGGSVEVGGGSGGREIRVGAVGHGEGGVGVSGVEGGTNAVAAASNSLQRARGPGCSRGSTSGCNHGGGAGMEAMGRAAGALKTEVR
jgi:hypothetical protein